MLKKRRLGPGWELAMLVDPSNSNAGSSVTGAIRQASQATGTSFNYLLATAKVESGLNPQAGASTSSARGLFQFIEQTWLATLKQAGPALGYGRYADAITKTAAGQYEVQDPAMRNEILKLRNDPTANAVMAGAFTQSNADILKEQLGRAPSEPELYIAHFLGAPGAARLISLAASNPNAKAADYFPGAAQANSPIFYDRSTGKARSLAQVRNVLTARYDVARVRPGDSSTPADADAAAPAVAAAPVTPVAMPVKTATATVPDTAGMTDAFASAIPIAQQHDGRVFHGLFQDPERTGPVAAVVSELWGVPKGSQQGGASMFDLFRDPAQKS
jgi:Transglycosylase SLT domain